MITTSINEIVENLPGWCTAEKAGILYDLVKNSDAQLVVELGVFGGRSLVPMALACKDKGSGKVIGIDSWRKDESLHGTNAPENNEWWEKLDFNSIYKIAKAAILTNGLLDYAELIKTSTQQYAGHNSDESIDIIHQDSAHNVETITEELELWIPKLKTGGYWIADDTDWIEAKDGYKKLPEYGLELVEDHHKWQIWKKIK